MLNNIVLHGFGLTKTHSSWKEHTSSKLMIDRLYFVLSGEAKCIANNKTYNFLPNHVYLIPAMGKNVQFVCSPDYPMHHLYFDFISPTYRLYNGVIDIDMTLEENLIYKKYFEYLKLFFESNSITNANFLSSPKAIEIYHSFSGIVYHQLSSILYSIDRTYSLNITANPIITNAINYIHENFDKPISIKELAAFSFIDESYFIKIFKKYMHQSPYQFIKAYRFNNALKMLELNMPIHEIAMKTGFDSNASFSKSFKKEFGTSPSSYYRKEHN